ncbi:MAG: GGDEF domain-containing protein [Sphaerochaeta sp.]
MCYAWLISKRQVPGIGYWTLNLFLYTIGLALQMLFVQTGFQFFRIIANLMLFSGGLIFYIGFANYTARSIHWKICYGLMFAMIVSSLAEIFLSLPLELFIIINALYFLAIIALYHSVFIPNFSGWFGSLMVLLFVIYSLLAVAQIYRIITALENIFHGTPSSIGYDFTGYTITAVVNRLMLFIVNFIVLLLVYKRLLHDLHEQVENQRTLSLHLKNLAEHDELTGLYNRRTIEQMISQYIPQMQGETYSVLFMLDIDHFKNLNDAYGHQCGDTVLHYTAKGLSSLQKPLDLLGRWGGDEFLLLVEREKGEAISAYIQDLQIMMQQICKKYPKAGGCSISGGFTRIISGDTLDSALERADAKLYHAKQAGRNQIIGNLEGDSA